MTALVALGDLTSVGNLISLDLAANCSSSNATHMVISYFCLSLYFSKLKFTYLAVAGTFLQSANTNFVIIRGGASYSSYVNGTSSVIGFYLQNFQSGVSKLYRFYVFGIILNDGFFTYQSSKSIRMSIMYFGSDSHYSS